MIKNSILFLLTLSSFLDAKPLRFALNWKPEPEFGGFYEAALAGIYKKHKLDIEIIPGGAGTPAVQMVGAGSVELGISSGDEVAIARSRGSDVVALFSVYQSSPAAIIVHAEANFKDIGDVIKGEGTLAVQKGLPFVEFLFNKYGPVKAKVVPYLGGIGNFMADPKFSQMGFATAEPLQIEKAGGKAKVFLVSEAGYDPYTEVVIAKGDFIKKNPKVVADFVKATQEGWSQYMTSPTKTNVYMNKLNPSMDPETFEKCAQTQKPFIENADTKKLGLVFMTKERWEKLSSQLVALKIIDKKAPAGDYFVWK